LLLSLRLIDPSDYIVLEDGPPIGRIRLRRWIGMQVASAGLGSESIYVPHEERAWRVVSGGLMLAALLTAAALMWA
jgi:hypothetical protein